MNGIGRLLILLTMTLLTAGCTRHLLSDNALSTVDLAGGYETFLQSPRAHIGQTILLGGYVVDYLITREGTTLRIQPYALNKRGVPERLIREAEEVLARTDRLLPPDEFGAGHMVSLTGTYAGREPSEAYDRPKPRMVFDIGEIRSLPPPAHYPYGYHYPGRLY